MKNKNIWIYLSPWIITFLLFSVYPLIFSFILSFTNYNSLNPAAVKFIGFKNYIFMFSDKLFSQSFINTVLFTIISLPGTLILSFIVALFINEKIKFKKIYRASYFFPVLTSIVIISTIFIYLYSPYGILNYIIQLFGFAKINFLTDTKYALYSIIIMDVWASFGYYTLLFLAALQSIPEEQYESAEIDGAGIFAKIFYITIPGIKKMLLFIVIINTIRSLQIFSEIFIMTSGGPLNSTSTIVYYLYDIGFRKFKLGYASAISYVLFLLILFFSLIQMRFLRSEK